MRRKWKLASLILIFVLMVSLTMSGCSQQSGENEAAADKLVIASQNFAEPQILSEMVRQLLEAKLDITVDHKRNFQGSTAVHQALETGDVHMYFSYTGTQFTGVLGMEVTEEWKDRNKVYEYVRDQYKEKFNIRVFEPLGFNNTYALAVRRETAEALNLTKASDLAAYSQDMVIATDPTFQERKGDGWKELAELYGYNFKNVVGMSYDLMYQALHSKDVDAAVAYSTDGRVPAYDLVILEDDRNFFPPYDGVFFIREEILEQYPEIDEIISPLIGAFTEEIVAELNSQVDVEKKEPEEVAREYLEANGLL